MLVVVPAAQAKPANQPTPEIRKYAVTYTGSWHREGSFTVGNANEGFGTATFTDDAQWNLRSKGAPVEIATFRGRGTVDGGVDVEDMRGTAIRDQTYSEPGFPTNFARTEGPSILNASLDDDEGTDRQHAIGVTSTDYPSESGDLEVYPMAVNAGRPRKSYTLDISESQTSEDGSSYTISATWTLELAGRR